MRRGNLALLAFSFLICCAPAHQRLQHEDKSKKLVEHRYSQAYKIFHLKTDLVYLCSYDSELKTIYAEADKATDAVDFLAAIIAKHKCWAVRKKAVQELAKIIDPRKIKLLIAALGDEHQDVRYSAATALVNINDPRALKPLVDALGDPKESDWGKERMATLLINMIDSKEEPSAATPVVEYVRTSPNPMHDKITFEYKLNGKSQVTLDLYNETGELVRNLIDYYHEPGEYRVVWRSTDNDQDLVGAGLYLYVFRAEEVEKAGQIVKVNKGVYTGDSDGVIVECDTDSIFSGKRLPLSDTDRDSYLIDLCIEALRDKSISYTAVVLAEFGPDAKKAIPVLLEKYPVIPKTARVSIKVNYECPSMFMQRPRLFIAHEECYYWPDELDSVFKSISKDICIKKRDVSLDESHPYFGLIKNSLMSNYSYKIDQEAMEEMARHGSYAILSDIAKLQSGWYLTFGVGDSRTIIYYLGLERSYTFFAGAYALSKITGQDLGPYNYDERWKKWWENNKDVFK